MGNAREGAKTWRCERVCNPSGADARAFSLRRHTRVAKQGGVRRRLALEAEATIHGDSSEWVRT